MAERNERFDALILRARETPQGTRVVSLLGAQAGILDAFVFGGARSSLRSTASPYVYAVVSLYHDPVKDFRKITDISIIDSLSGIRMGYGKLLCAGAIAETILKTHAAGGEYAQSLELALGALKRIEKAQDDDKTLGFLLAYLWETLTLLGLDPDMETCASCGRPLFDAPGERTFRLSTDLPGFVCRRCDPEGRIFPFLVLEILQKFKIQGFEAWDALVLSEQSRRDLFDLVRGLARHATEDSLLFLSSDNFSSFFPESF
ncbi:MAG: DNA repair protein RecO (recombination protein O) [Spirochaetes bacterium]|nr:MAG: DNA repair protein RecO (recombination protein O) [Spirochaetota bacterium]